MSVLRGVSPEGGLCPQWGSISARGLCTRGVSCPVGGHCSRGGFSVRSDDSVSGGKERDPL